MLIINFTCLWDSSRCFINTATTTLTNTNCAIKTKTTKKSGAKYGDTQQFLRQSSPSSHSSLKVSFIIPFQLSPVAMRNNVRKAIPNERKCACSPNPWHGCSSSHSVNVHELIFVTFKSRCALVRPIGGG